MNSLAEIDAEIGVLERKLADMRRLRNSLMYICRLPVEIMVVIYRHVQLTEQQPARHIQRIHDKSYEDDPIDHIFVSKLVYPRIPTTWIAFMLACVSLREIAVQARELWRHVQVPSSSQWVKLCLVRSVDLPLHLYACFPSDRSGDSVSQDDMNIFFSCTSRAMDAFVEVGSSFENAVFTTRFRDALNQHCGHLQRFRMLSWDEQYSVTDKFLGGKSTSLTTLQLHVESVTSWPKLPHLINLSVRTKSTASMRVVISGLTESQHLRLLSIQVMAWNENESTILVEPGNQVCAALPRLEVLRIRGRVEKAAVLLKTLPDPRLVLDITSWPDREPQRVGNLQELQAYSYLVHRVTQYWSSHSDISLFTGVLYLKAEQHVMETKFRMSSSPTFSDVSDIHRLSCNFSATHFGNSPAMNLIKTIIISGDRAGPVGLYKGDKDDGNIAMMDLDVVQVKNAKTEVHISLLAKWLKSRKSQGKPVRSLQILEQGTEKVAQSLHDMGTRLKKQKIIQEVGLM
jgi:hypothetical protein